MRLSALGSYEEKSRSGKRPEEVDQEWLYEPAWEAVNQCYARWGIHSRLSQLSATRAPRIRSLRRDVSVNQVVTA